MASSDVFERVIARYVPKRGAERSVLIEAISGAERYLDMVRRDQYIY
ncbi:hypothetical protein HED50_02560 [Ochrobactrum oryzae]|nr:hypothetical protein [Brucella oryzae]